MNLIEKFQLITTFILDVDGVLTDGTVYVFDSGEQVRRDECKRRICSSAFHIKKVTGSW